MPSEELYVELYDLLRDMAVYRYGVPEQDAEDLVQDVFTSFLSKPVPVVNPRAYLLGAIRLASRLYWRRESKFDREAAIPERGVRPPVFFLRNLTKRHHEVLALRLAGWTIKEIAARMQRSPSWVEKAWRRAREAAKEEIDLTNRGWEGRRVGRTDTYVSVTVAIMRAHVRPVRGPALPRAADRAPVLCAHRRPAGQVRGQLSVARGMVPASRRAA